MDVQNMNTQVLNKRVYVTKQQKRRLLRFLSQHPELTTGKITPEFTVEDSKKMWQKIADECNAMPGAKKTWRLWRKCWQDIKSKTKKRKSGDDDEQPFPTVETILETKTVASSYPKPEFVPFESEDPASKLNIEIDYDDSNSFDEPDSPPEQKVFAQSNKNINSRMKHSSSTSNGLVPGRCEYNCDLLALTEEKKLQIKEDYLSFKKDYLKQKLECLKQQTSALESIAKALSNKPEGVE